MSGERDWAIMAEVARSWEAYRDALQLGGLWEHLDEYGRTAAEAAYMCGQLDARGVPSAAEQLAGLAGDVAETRRSRPRS